MWKLPSLFNPPPNPSPTLLVWMSLVVTLFTSMLGRSLVAACSMSCPWISIVKSFVCYYCFNIIIPRQASQPPAEQRGHHVSCTPAQPCQARDANVWKVWSCHEILWQDGRQGSSPQFNSFVKTFSFAAGGEEIGFNNSVFLSERDTADRNFALAYFMKENKCFPKHFNLQECLDFYFQVSHSSRREKLY